MASETWCFQSEVPRNPGVDSSALVRVLRLKNLAPGGCICAATAAAAAAHNPELATSATSDSGSGRARRSRAANGS